MDLIEEKPDFEFFIRRADGRSAQVNERLLQASFIIAPDRLIEDWPPRRLDQLDIAAMQALIDVQPEVVILGTGERQAFPAAEVMAAFLQRGIGIEAMANAAAARTFDILAGEGRRVAAGFLLGD